MSLAEPDTRGVVLPVTEGTWTIEDIPDSEHRIELVDGALLVSPPPASEHQIVLSLLQHLAGRAVKPARILQGAGVGFDENNLRVPDLVIVRDGVAAWGRPYFAPTEILLAVEVLSPSSARTDPVLKRAQYAAAGIAHYWMVRTRPRLEVTVLDLPAGAVDYTETGTWSEGQTLTVRHPFPLSFDITDLRG